MAKYIVQSLPDLAWLTLTHGLYIAKFPPGTSSGNLTFDARIKKNGDKASEGTGGGSITGKTL